MSLSGGKSIFPVDETTRLSPITALLSPFATYLSPPTTFMPHFALAAIPNSLRQKAFQAVDIL